jgi:hypothetical protein
MDQQPEQVASVGLMADVGVVAISVKETGAAALFDQSGEEQTVVSLGVCGGGNTSKQWWFIAPWLWTRIIWGARDLATRFLSVCVTRLRLPPDDPIDVASSSSGPAHHLLTVA